MSARRVLAAVALAASALVAFPGNAAQASPRPRVENPTRGVERSPRGLEAGYLVPWVYLRVRGIPAPSHGGWLATLALDGSDNSLPGRRVTVWSNRPDLAAPNLVTTLTTGQDGWAQMDLPISNPYVYRCYQARLEILPSIPSRLFYPVCWDQSGFHGDVTGDGLSDVVARRSDGAVVIHPGRWDWTMGAAQLALASPPSTNWVGSPGDADRDGYQDLLTRRTDGTIWLYPGRGAGRFSAPVKIGSGFGAMTAMIAVGDVSGDTWPDLLTRTSTGSLVMWGFRGRSRPVYTMRSFGTGWNGVRTFLGAGSTDGFGVDLLGIDSQGVMRRYQLGSTSQVTTATVSSGWTGYTSIASPGDLTGDGFSDLVVRLSNGQVGLLPSVGQWVENPDWVRSPGQGYLMGTTSAPRLL